MKKLILYGLSSLLLLGGCATNEVIVDPVVGGIGLPGAPSLNNSDNRNAYILVVASALAKLDQNTIKNAVAEKGFTQFAYFERDEKTTTGVKTKNNAHMFIAANETDVIVAFRGSGSFKDWSLDFTAAPVAVDSYDYGGKMHLGFMLVMENANSLAKGTDKQYWAAIKEKINEFDPERTKTIWVSGHSFGGALSTLVLTKLTYPDGITKKAEDCTKVRKVYAFTYGQPRVGGKDFRKAFDDSCISGQLTRYYIAGDPVTAMPPHWSWTGLTTFVNYRHVGNSYDLGSSAEGVARHFIGNYIEAVGSETGAKP